MYSYVFLCMPRCPYVILRAGKRTMQSRANSPYAFLCRVEQGRVEERRVQQNRLERSIVEWSNMLAIPMAPLASPMYPYVFLCMPMHPHVV